MTIASDSAFTVGPSVWLVLWGAYVLAVMAVAVVTALKGRYIWLLVGLLLGGLPLFYSAFLPPESDSAWARWATRRRGRLAADQR